MFDLSKHENMQYHAFNIFRTVSCVIVHRGEWLWELTKFSLVCFCLSFLRLPWAKLNNCLLVTVKLTGVQQAFWLRNSCIVHERKTKDCARSWTFQHKSWHLRLLLLCQNQSPLLNISGGSRGGARETCPPPPLYIGWKIEDMTEGRKVCWASKLKPGPLLSSKSGSATDYCFVRCKRRFQGSLQTQKSCTDVRFDRITCRCVFFMISNLNYNINLI